MPSQKTASKKEDLVNCQVLRGIGLPVSDEDLKIAKDRAKRKGLDFTSKGLTTMVFPNKDIPAENGKSMIKGEPVFVELERSVAKKLSEVGAVRVAL